MELGLEMKINVQIESTEYSAKGLYSIENQTVLVLKGSKFRLSYVDSLKRHPYFSKREVFFSSGNLDDEGILIQDYEFDNPSIAASLIQGRSSNGKKDWKLEDGTPLDEYLNKDITLESDEKKFEYVLEFLKDIDRLNEVNDELGFNVFKTLNIVNTEIRHSNVLAWLFDPNETHQLKDLFFKYFLQKMYLENQAMLKSLDIEQLFLWDFDDITVYREKDHIDILIVDDTHKLVIAIENKVKSTEHSNQLNRYKDIILKQYPNQAYKKIFIYLTIDQEEPSDSDWIPISYLDVLELIDKVKLKTVDKVKIFLEDYSEIIRREIMEDEKLVKLCQDIYKRHKNALDLIYQYKPDEISEISNTIIQSLNTSEQFKLKTSKKNIIRFSTNTIDSINEKFKEVAAPGWVKEKAVLLYEIKLQAKQISLNIVVGPTVDDSRNKIVEHYKQMTSNHIKDSSKWTTLKSLNLLSMKSIEETENIIDKIENNFTSIVTKFALEIDKVFENYNINKIKVESNDK
jgi:hypothetical protein